MRVEFLLVKTTAVALNALVLPEVNTVSSSAEQLREKIPTLFRGVGKLKGYQATLHVDVEVPPVAQRQCRIPYADVHAVDKKLEELLSTDFIEETDGPTPLVSPVVIAPKKNGDIRLCVDLRRVNKAIIRERHPLPTMDEILHQENGSTVFSKSIFVGDFIRWNWRSHHRTSQHLLHMTSNACHQSGYKNGTGTFCC